MEPESDSTSRSCSMDRLRILRLCCITNPLVRCRHCCPYLSSSWVLLVKTDKSHFCMELTLSSSGGCRAESALLGFAPVVPGCLGISNLRLRPLIILLSKLPNIWVCKIGLEVWHKHALPSSTSVFICQGSLGLPIGTEDSAWKPMVYRSIAWKVRSLADWWLACWQLEWFILWGRNPVAALSEASVEVLTLPEP